MNRNYDWYIKRIKNKPVNQFITNYKTKEELLEEKKDLIALLRYEKRQAKEH